MLARLSVIEMPTNWKQCQPVCASLAGVFVMLVGFFLPLSTSLTEIFFYGAVVLGIASGEFTKNWRVIIRSDIGVFMLLLYALLALSVIYSTVPAGHALAGLFKYNKLLLGALLMPVLVDKKWREYAVISLMVSIAVLMIWSYSAVIKQMLDHAKVIDATVIKDHIQQNYCMALGAYLFAEGCFRYRRYWWLLLPLALLAVINVMFLSAGRSGYFVFGLLFVLFFWQHVGKRGVLIALLLMFTLCVTAFFTSSVFGFLDPHRNNHFGSQLPLVRFQFLHDRVIFCYEIY